MANIITAKIKELKEEGITVCCVITDSGSDFKRARLLLAQKFEVRS